MADIPQIWRWGPVTRGNAIAASAILPGDLVEVITAAGADQGKVRRHATAAGRADPMFADCNWPYGGGLADAYAAGDSVPLLAPSVGSIVFARCATGIAIPRGQTLESAGDGTLRLTTTGVVVGAAAEAESTVGEPSPGYLRVRITAQ
jgi:hypothetical protein